MGTLVIRRLPGMHAGSGPRRARGATSGDVPGVPRDPVRRRAYTG
jgi:hypothetical protein